MPATPADPPQDISPTITIEPARTGDAAAVRSAVEIGNASQHLGHLPFAVYEDAAHKGCLLLARDGEKIIGYALYGLTRRHVRLTHLCIRSDYRGQGIARQLVERIVDERAGYLGIRASCRHNYGLGKMWASLGFARSASDLAEAAMVTFW